MNAETAQSNRVEETAQSIELNELFVRALDEMENSQKNVFVTGKAGTGKSTLLDYFRKTTKKKIAVLAPTGVAAVNILGQTIHSFFGFRPDITLQKIKRVNRAGLYRALDAVVIDEISMVRADLLDCVDKFLRLNGKNQERPFGGIQMIFFGDLYQLPPVVTGKEKEIFKTHYKSQYFFDAKAFENFRMDFIELEKIYRQKDEKFIELLNSIRNNSATEKELALLNRRVDAAFETKPGEFYIQLATLNEMANKKNEVELAKLKTRLFAYKGGIKGNFDLQYLPCEIELKLKVGSQIMLLNNDSQGRWINGSVGKIVDIEKSGTGNPAIIVELRNGQKAEVEPYTWKIFQLEYNQNAKALESRTIGSFTQYPLKLAWAVTIHKSQGKTFDKVIIDIGKGTFAHGQMYVALSRCTSLDGIVLKKPIEKKHILMDWRIVKFLTQYQYALSEKKCCLEEKIKIIENAIKNKSKLDIVYLRNNDEKSKRTILPKRIGQMEYLGKAFFGMEAYCFSRQQNRTFKVERILEINECR